MMFGIRFELLISATIAVLGLPAVCIAHPKAGTLIIGGEDSSPGEFPFFISVNLLSFNLTFAGGVLIQHENKQFVLTAAHRVWVYRDNGGDYDLDRLTLVGGDHSVRESSGNEQLRKTNRVIVHPDYYPYEGLPRPKNIEPDLAIIALTEDYEFTDFVQPVTLPAINSTSASSGVIMGFGGKHSSGNYSEDYETLQKLNVNISTHEECVERYQSHPNFTPEPNNRCVESSQGQGGNFVCYSDLGGPVVSNDGVLQGIITYPDSCITDIQPERPDVMLAISTYVEWIHKTAGDL